MSKVPPTTFFLYSAHEPVSHRSAAWKTPLFLGIRPSQTLPQQKRPQVTHADYFSAARIFLEKNNFEAILRAASIVLKRNISIKALDEIRICLVKHGEFYHPARVEAVIRGTPVPFVLNVAISETGKNGMAVEYPLLERFHNEFSNSFVPAVYSRQDVLLQDRRLEFSLFLGEWFEGFNEFHIARDPSDGRNKVCVWDPAKGNYFLSLKQEEAVYRKAAGILTFYYNLYTFEQIFSWHHAAGDFIINVGPEDIDVRLVTVRQYVALFENQKPDAALILDALLIFLLNLSLRMRLDRYEGVGEIVWSNDVAVEGTLTGFFEGLAINPGVRSIRPPLPELFKVYLEALSEKELMELLQGVMERNNPRTADMSVIKQNLKKHAAVLYRAIAEM